MFASALRTLLKEGPNINDGERNTRLKHCKNNYPDHFDRILVLSTLYANDAPSAVERLIYMGLPPPL